MLEVTMTKPPPVRRDVTRAEFERLALLERWEPTITLLMYPTLSGPSFGVEGRGLLKIVDWPIPAPRF